MFNTAVLVQAPLRARVLVLAMLMAFAAVCVVSWRLFRVQPNSVEAPLITAPSYSARVEQLLNGDERLRVLPDELRECVGEAVNGDDRLLAPEAGPDRDRVVVSCERAVESTAVVLDASGSVTVGQRRCVREALRHYSEAEHEQLRAHRPAEIPDEALRRRVLELPAVCGIGARSS